MKHLGKLALALFAAGSWWFAFLQETETPAAIVKPAHKIDYFLKDFSVLSMTLEGKKKQLIQAAHMQHYIDDDSTELTKPVMTLYSADKPNVHITSKTGYVSSDGELVLLNGAVNIKRGALNNIAPFEINTDNLRIQPANNVAETDDFVSITSGDNKIEGVGLRAHFREPINIQILNKVRSQHAIN